MALPPGTRLGPCEITAPLGAGGMGEVYRARDTELKRDVAVKVLPSGVGSDPERLTRFKREAELLAALNHPHVAQVYGLTATPDGAPAMVMELVEGETLADLIARGPVAVSQALAIARQVADGLEAAHDAGVIHRDLKPANVKARPDGTVKLLDFGLARTAAAPTADGSHAPTITSPAMTQAGVVLGTAAYMSPEQARGQVADARSDIWAFGCVLFELLTGRRAFPGDTIADVTTAVLSREPDWGQLPAAARGQVVHVLRRCLARERRERYGAIADVRYDLLERPAPPTTESTTARRHGVASLLAAAVGGALVVALGVGLTRTAPVPPTSDTLTGAMLIASTGRMQFGHAEVALDPGGRSVAYESADDSGLNRIWIQPLDGRDARPVQGTEGGRGPAFSNDGRWLAFTANARLMKVAVEGGRALTLADAPHMHGAAWTTDDRAIVFAPTLTRGLWRVPAEGGAASQLTRVDAAAGELSHEWPVIAPNGRLHFVVNAQLRPFDDSHIAVVDDSTGTWSTVVRHALAPRFDHAGRLFHLDGTGAIVVNDPATVNPSRLAAQVFTVSGNGLYSIAGNGVLVFARALDYGRRELIVATPDGQRRVVSDQRPYLALAVSPDARRVAASVVGGAVLVSDIARPAWTVTTATAYRPRLLWTPDSRRIVFTPGPGRLALIDPAGRTDEEPMSLPNVSSALAWLPGTLALIVRTLTSPTLFVHTLGVPDDRVLTGFEQYPSMLFAAVEPKRRLIPYGSDYTGRHDVYLRPLEGREPAIRVTTGNPGTEPLWSADGRQLFFADGAQGLKVVEVTAPPLSVSPERPVAGVDTKAASIGDRQTYAALPDGSILFVQEGDTTERDRVYVFQDWRALLHAAAGQR